MVVLEFKLIKHVHITSPNLNLTQFCEMNKKPVMLPPSPVSSSILLRLGCTCNRHIYKVAEISFFSELVLNKNESGNLVLSSHPEQTPSPRAWQDHAKAGIPDEKTIDDVQNEILQR